MLRIFQACRGLSRVRLTRFEQRWTEDKSSSVHRETVALTMRVKPGLLETQQRQQRRQQQSHVNTSEDNVQLQRRRILREDEIRTFSWMTDVEKTFFEILFFLCAHFDTMIDVAVKKRGQRIGMLYFQYWEQGSVRNPKINWKENSRVRIGRIAFATEASYL